MEKDDGPGAFHLLHLLVSVQSAIPGERLTPHERTFSTQQIEKPLINQSGGTTFQITGNGSG
ncbi:hypothetical protein [Bordetella hinzii]|nr:hypothetical protein [Bordetella hinzii]MBZ0075564.1 hypothetical protein [Bordetella hinzii]MBZ0078597.1 hypothetical protein [Bordetella hinzii]MBZ0083777.1 hypothetical protein [Bordetella hinzii]QET45577.1 hypothetical protein FOB29_19060 [Bordetella hinzii]